MNADKPRKRIPMSDEARAALLALDAQIAAEDREDARLEALRVREGTPEPPRDLRTGPGWADGGLTLGRQEP